MKSLLRSITDDIRTGPQKQLSENRETVKCFSGNGKRDRFLASETYFKN